jgi:hypothetical protein
MVEFEVLFEVRFEIRRPTMADEIDPLDSFVDGTVGKRLIQ